MCVIVLTIKYNVQRKVLSYLSIAKCFNCLELFQFQQDTMAVLKTAYLAVREFTTDF